MLKNFDIVDLYSFYGRNILKESVKKPLLENEDVIDLDKPKLKDTELIRKIMAERSKRFKTIIYFDDDPALIPSSFQISYTYKIIFDINQIKKDYSSTQLDNDDENIDDDAIDRMIMQKMKNKDKGIEPKKQMVDMDGFYVDVFKKNLPSYTLNGKLNDLIRAGVLPIDNWKVYTITYSTQVTDDLLFRNLEKAVKQNKPAYLSPFGYEIGFECTDKRTAKTKNEVVEFALKFSKGLEGSIFKDTQYYKIKR